MKAYPPTVLLLDFERGSILRYVCGVAVERFEITDRAEFDRDFSPQVAERIRLGHYVEPPTQ